MKGHCRLIVIALSVIIAVLIAVIGVISWCYIPIKFEGSPGEMRITRLDGISFDAYDPEAGKSAESGYAIAKEETNLSDRVRLFDMLSDIERTDIVPEFDNRVAGHMPALAVKVGNELSYIAIMCDVTRSYIKVSKVLQSEQFVNPVPTDPIYYTADPDKVNKLITHIIARAEKLHPEAYGL